jgi:hypothetical protein
LLKGARSRFCANTDKGLLAIRTFSPALADNFPASRYDRFVDRFCRPILLIDFVDRFCCVAAELGHRGCRYWGMVRKGRALFLWLKQGRCA